MGRTSSTTHRWLFCRALHLTPSDKKMGLALRMVRVVKRRCPLVSDVVIKPRAKHTLLFSFNLSLFSFFSIALQ